MTNLRHAVVPAYVLLCVVLGGASSAGIIANVVLQLAALPLLVWAVAADTASVTRAGRLLLALAATLVVVVVAQLVPLPPAIWMALPGRESVVRGYELLAVSADWHPISLAPEGTLSGLLWLLPTFATLLAMLRLGAFRAPWLGWTVVAATCATVMIGALQILGGSDSPWYFYRITNWGFAVGFFANSNHTATLLVVAIPFVAALQARGLTRRRGNHHIPALLVMTSAALGVIAVGLLLNSSLAGIGLAVPATLASFMLLRTTNRRRAKIGGLIVGLLGITMAVAVVQGPFNSNLFNRAEKSSEIQQLTRSTTILTTFNAGVDHLPLGSGIGSFRDIYQTYENPDAVTTTYINHAHSDVVEIFLELGIPGVMLMLALIGWWAWCVVRLWSDSQPDYFARAGAIGAAIIMAHSLVDYPMRTAAIGALFAICLALMAGARAYVRPSLEHGGARHLSAD